MLRKVNSVVSCQLSVVRRSIFLCILSAGLLILSFPKFNLEFLAWVGFVPLFFALKNKSKAKAFLLAYLTGLIFWSGIIYWLVHVTLPGTALLILYLALYFGAFGLIISTIDPLLIASAWVLLEYVRAHLFTGFPWALLGYSQYLNLPVIQIADVTGVYGVSFLVMMVNVAIKEVLGVRFWVLGKKEQKRKLWIISPAVLCFIFAITYGYYKLNQTPNTKHQTPIKISVIQGNVPQHLKWDVGSRDFIIDKYLTLTKQVLKEKPDLIIWPEAALPVVLEEEPRFFERVKDFVCESKTPLLLGAVTLRDNLYYNSALLVSSQGETLAKYDKLHLVPFGEYIPLRRILRFLETVVPIGDFSRGKEFTIFSLTPNTYNLRPNFSVLICFEDLFPELSRQFVRKGAQFLVNITNDAWFGKTSSPFQHLQASVFRAVENRVSLLRSANTGVSGFIAPSGKIISLIQDNRGENIFIDGYKTQEIIIPKRLLSFYTRYGDVFIVACFLFLLLYSIICNLKTQSATAGTTQN